MFFRNIAEDPTLQGIYEMQQRGGRMLSLIDLINAQTIPLDVAAYTVLRVINGASISSGALIGGTGKTTLLASLLAFLPPEVELVTVTASNLTTLQEKNKSIKTCYLCHEISPAMYYSYLWGKDISRYISLKRNDYTQLAFTIHADKYEEVYKQIVNPETALDRADFLKIDMFIFIKDVGTGFNSKRKVTFLYDLLKPESEKHDIIYDYYTNFVQIPEIVLNNKTFIRLKNIIKTMIDKNIYRIEDVRRNFLSLLPEII